MTIQTSLQALRIFHQAQADPNVDLAVTSSGEVRIATLFDRAINKITDMFRISSVEHRREQARQTIRDKFASEISVLGRDLSTPQNHLMFGLLEKMIAGQDESKALGELTTPPIAAALRHIREISDIAPGKDVRIAWQAMTERIADNKAPDMTFAREVARLTAEHQQKLHMDSKSAYRMAYNAAALHKRYGIETADAREILQISGQLIVRHGFENDAALTLAIDLLIPLRKAGISMIGLGRVLRAVQAQLPELAHCSPRTRISAALCYVQLQDVSSGVDKPIEEIRHRLADLKVLQGLMPRGCVIDQIHQGCHVRGKTALDSEGLESLCDSTASLATDYKTFDGSEVTTRLPAEFRQFEKQFVKDIVRDRNFAFELKHNGLPDTGFASVEKERRQAPEALTEQAYADWARGYQSHAGSINAAGALSRLQSQTIFADIDKVTADRLKNADGYATKAYGDPKTTRIQFVADRRDGDGEAHMDLRSRQFVDARVLVADPTGSGQGALQRVQVQLMLLPSGEWLPSMQGPVAALMRDCAASIPIEALDEGSTAASVKQLVETWDLVPDWDAWMQNRAPLL